MSFNKIWPSFWVSILNFWGWWWNFTGAYFLNGCFNHQQAIALRLRLTEQEDSRRQNRCEAARFHFLCYPLRDTFTYIHYQKTTKYKLIYMDGTGVGRVSAFCAIQRTKRKRKMFHVFFLAMFSREALLGSPLGAIPGEKKHLLGECWPMNPYCWPFFCQKGGLTYPIESMYIHVWCIYLHLVVFNGKIW